MPHYRILSGTFRLDDGTLASPGDTIELGDDVAAQHPDKVALLPEPAADQPAE